MSPQSYYTNGNGNVSSGLNTPESELESILPIHPTADRRPYLIEVASQNTNYTDDFITAKFTDRGANVETLPNGQLKITPVNNAYEFKTERKVPKTGYVFFYSIFLSLFLNLRKNLFFVHRSTLFLDYRMLTLFFSSLDS